MAVTSSRLSTTGSRSGVRPNDRRHGAHVVPGDFPVQKQQRAERLVLGRRAHVLVNREPGEKAVISGAPSVDECTFL